MNRLLLAIGGLMVGILALLFAAPAMVDWNRYRGIVEEEASRFLGRQVRVGGQLNLQLLPTPYVRVERVRVADTAANVGRPLFEAEELTVWLSVGALLSGALEAREIELKRPVVTFVLDGAGGGSWSGLAPDRFRGSLVPARVKLDAVRINNGTLALLGPAGEPRAALEHVNGELSAEALDGPYRITAAFLSGGAAREVRLSTAKAAEDGSVRFKGTVRAPASGVSYSLDGLARDVLGRIAVAGELTAKLPLPSAIAAPAAERKREASEQIDLRAELSGNASGFSLSELQLAFEQEGRPQLAKGDAKVAWGARTDVSVKLASQWLDLDRILGGGGSTPELAQSVAQALASALTAGGNTQAELAVEQATLGGDIVSDLVVSLEEAAGRLTVRNLAAALPGGARLSASGVFEGEGTAARFAGRLNLRGASLARLVSWAARGATVPLPARDGPFSVMGEVTLGGREIGGRNLAIEIGRNQLAGEVGWRAGAPQRISLNLEGTELDLTPLVAPGADAAKAVRDLIAGLAAPSGPSQAGAGAAEADIKLRVDRLVIGGTQLRDASAELRVVDGNLAMPQLKLASADGYAVELRGDIADLARGRARGALSGLLTATSATGAIALARAVGLPEELIPGSTEAALLTPLRLAGSLAVGQRGTDTLDLTLDGKLAASRVAGTVRLGGDGASWRDRAIDLALSAEGGELARLVTRAMAARGAETTSASALSLALSPPARRLVVRGIGVVRTGVTTLAAVDGEGMAAEFRGRLRLEDSGALAADGEATLDVDQLAQGLALAGLPRRPGLDGRLKGVIRVERAEGRTRLASQGIEVAGTSLSGNVTLETTGQGRRASGELQLDRGGLPGLLELLASPAARSEAAALSPWSEGPLDLAFLEGLAGSRVRLDVGRLALAPGIEIGEARLEITVRPGGALDVRLLEGKSFGGAAAGLISLEKAPAGARLAIEAGLVGLRLEALAAREGGPPKAGGTLSATLKAQSAALSPRGLVVALTGGGELMLGQVRLNRWGPSAIATATESVLSQKGELVPGALRRELAMALETGGVSMGSPRLALSVQDGALRTAPLQVAAPGGRLVGKAAIDLDQMLLDGEWRLEAIGATRPAVPPTGGVPVPVPVARGDLPGITLSWAGPLARLRELEARLDTEALEREVAVRKVEREVAELERLRRLDEERARQEQLRLEAERAELERRRAEQLRLNALPPVPAPAAPQLQPPPTSPKPGALPRPHSSLADPAGTTAAAHDVASDSLQRAGVVAPAGAEATAPVVAARPPDAAQGGTLPADGPWPALPALPPLPEAASVERAAAPRPLSPQGGRRDPFRSLREGSP